MTERSTPRPLPDDPRLQAFLPLLYVAWADSELEDDEIRAVCGRVQREISDKTCHDLLGRWLDPRRPPSAEDLAHLLELLRSSAQTLDPAERESLSALGVALARRAGHDPSPAEVDALADVERALGLAPEESSARLLSPARPVATWHTTDTIQACREACGGQGYLAENRFAALKADTEVFTTFEGDNTVLLQLVAKGLLAGYRSQFHDLSTLGLVRWLVRRTASDLAEHNPLVTRRSDEAHLRDRELHLGLLRWREQRLLDTLARRLKARLDRGLSSFSALSECQDHVLEAAQAFVDRLALESYHRWAADAPEPLRDLLVSVGDLHALATLEEQKGFFLEHGHIDPPKSRAIRTLVNQLCGELRPHAGGLVEAFGLSGEVLGAPIAAD